MTTPPTRNTIDLFSGAGGLSLGLHLAGWHVLLAIENDPSASATYRRNFPTTHLQLKNIQEIDFSAYKEQVDLVAGGPPCQPFSVAGNQLAEDDPRDMVPEFIKAVNEICPKSFLMENVPGLLTAENIEYTNRIIEKFQHTGYNVYVKKLNAADFGIPQFRECVFFVGIRNNLKLRFLFPLPRYGPKREYPHITVCKALENTPEDEPNTAKITIRESARIQSFPDDFVFTRTSRVKDSTKRHILYCAEQFGWKNTIGDSTQ